MNILEARVKWSEAARFEGIDKSGHSIIVDGDSEAGNSPMELVLVALCGCTAYDVVSILGKKREPFVAIEVSATGEKAADPPRVFTQINLSYRVAGNVSRKAVEDAVRLSEEKYCSVAAMLRKTSKITYEIHLDSE